MEEPRAIGLVRKLALWHTGTFRPIMTHDELDPIMATLGFVSLSSPFSGNATPTSGWKEYIFQGGCCRNRKPEQPLPRPCLPFPRIDGLHVNTYKSFFDAISFYLTTVDVADHFHVRGMPLHRFYDRPFRQFRRINGEEGQYFYREVTLDPAMAACNAHSTAITATTSSCIVALKDQTV